MRDRPIVIAHRGASGYLPEHTLAAKALAVGMGADYLEQDVVATRDGQLIVFHDLTLDDVTNVAGIFPGRARDDGHFYCIDFTIDEIRQLSVRERRAEGTDAVLFPGRFPAEAAAFPVQTLDEELQFIRGLSRSTGRSIGIYVEIKEPGWHRQHGIDLGSRILDTVRHYGYGNAGLPAFIQCFDQAELRRIREARGDCCRLVQLLPSSLGQISREDLKEVASYADVIGPSIALILGRPGCTLPLQATSLVSDAHAAGLLVHPYTLRSDRLPYGIGSFEDAAEILLLQLEADGLFTDFPDRLRTFISARFAHQ